MKLNSILLCLLLALTANLFSVAKAQVNTTDSLAIVDLYNSTNGPNWYNHNNWLTVKPVSTWYGVAVTGDRVTSVVLEINNLTGPLPASIGNLMQMHTLSLGFNQLSGSIPSSIGNLASLRYLELYHNNLSGSIPDAIGNLTSAYGVYLYDNYLSGSIPASMGNMASLRELYLFDNQLSGSIPPEMGNLSGLAVLELNNNQLTGSIPAAVANMKNLTSLFLGNNHLSGAIPASLGRLKNLSAFVVSFNQLTGAVPASFRKLKNLSTFNAEHNYLTQEDNIHFSIATQYTYVYINNNLCTFNGLEFFAKHYVNVSYSPQNTILPIHQNGNMLSVNAGGTLSNNTYTWHKAGTADSIVIKHDSTFAPAQSGRYYVTVTNKIAKKLTLYSDTAEIVLPPIKQSNQLIAKSMEPATTIKHMQVYPNPAKDIIHIGVNGIATITLTNSSGKVLLTKTITGKSDINISTFASGMYYIQNKTTGDMQKIVVIH